MEKKLSVLNLAEELAEKSSITASQAEGFVRAFFDVLADGLAQDDIVKVKGWGTFKLSAVSNRESVDVNTGERIVIKGYRKVTFLPETALKDHINKPFAQFETTELNDSYSIEEETVDVEDAGLDTGALPHADEVNETFSPAAEEKPEVQEETTALEMPAGTESESETPSEYEAAADVEIKTEPEPVESAGTKAGSEEAFEPEATTKPETEITIEPESIPVPEDEPVIETSSEAESENEIEVIAPAKESVEIVSHEYIGSIPSASVPISESGPAEPSSETGTPEPEALKREPDNVKRTRRPRRSWHYWLPIVLLLLVSVCLYIYITFGKGFEKPKYALAAGEKENSIKVEHVDFSDKKPNIVIKTDSPKPTPAACSATASIVNDSSQITSEEGKTLEVKTIEAVPEEAKTLEVKPAQAEPAEAKSAEAKPAQQKTNIQPARSGEKSLKDITKADTTGYVILGTKATHTVQEGETIVQLARKYYNDKRLWPYIVKHNGLKNPNSVQVGKSIAIPELKAK